jgi:hypothetical protein
MAYFARDQMVGGLSARISRVDFWKVDHYTIYVLVRGNIQIAILRVIKDESDLI